MTLDFDRYARIDAKAATVAAERIRAAVEPDETEVVRVASDLTRTRMWGRTWLVATDRRLLVVPASTLLPVESVALTEITDILEIDAVGGGRLDIVSETQGIIRFEYSAAVKRHIRDAAGAIREVWRSRTPSAPVQEDRLWCPTCQRLLPEREGVCPYCLPRRRVLARVCSYLTPHKWAIAAVLLASIVMTLANLATPIITRSIVDDVLVPSPQAAASVSADRPLRLLGWLALLMLGVRLVSWVAEWVHGWITTGLGARVTANVRSQLYRHLEFLSLRYHDRRPVGASMSRVTNDAGTLQHFLIRGVPTVLINVLTIVGIVAVMLWMNWRLALAVLIPLPLLAYWSISFWRRLSPLLARWHRMVARFAARTREDLSGIRVTRAFAAERRQSEQFDRLNRAWSELNISINRSRAALMASIGVITGAGVGILWLTGGLQVLKGELTLGTLLAFYGYVFMLYGPLQSCGQVAGWLVQALTGAERIFEVLDTPLESGAGGGTRRLPRIRGAVRFEDVTFGYDPARPVVHHITLDVQPGERIAIVGRSGAGKTTLINLLCRFYQPDAGRIAVDEVDLRDISVADLRDQIAVVLQEPFLFSGSIAENIRYGRPEAGFVDVIAAARAAGAHEFIVAKDDGYDTDVGERGDRLSGGERQRIAIARALLRDPRILILDEATSSVDAQSEAVIREAIARLAEGRTTFIIAHRLSSVRHADRFVVLDQGRVLETGRYDELLQQRGALYQLVMSLEPALVANT
jgi:ATP-binding cassette subfamily B protein